MEKKKALPLILVVLMEVGSIGLFIASIAFFISVYFEKPEVTNQLLLKDNYLLEFAAWEVKRNIALVLMIVGLLQFLILRIPLKKMHTQSIMVNEYDEFGVSKKKRFENLSRKEREEIDRQKASLREQLLPTSVIKKITKHGSANPDKDLENLIGLLSVKQKVKEMTARMKFEMETQQDEKKKGKKDASTAAMNAAGGRHFVFYGSAGTGKTTTARIIAGYLYQYGYIKENKCIEINGGFLKEGEYTEEKTKLIIQESYGGVLFIDEAYSIIEGNANYGKAAIATLIKEMEDNRSRFTVILAGYKNDIRRLLDSNEGFKSRIKEYLEFPDYDAQEMEQIFSLMANEAGFVVDAGAMENYDTRIARERQLSSFGNGRTARNVLDEAIDKHALNYGQGNLAYVDENGITHENSESKYILRACDVSANPNKAVL